MATEAMPPQVRPSPTVATSSPALRVKNSTITGRNSPEPSESTNDPIASLRRGPSVKTSLPMDARHSLPTPVMPTARARARHP